MTAPLTTRPATAADLEVLCGFQQAMALETEGKRLDDAVLRRGLAQVLEDPVKGCYLLAERDGAAVGCAMWTREWSDWRGAWFWWFQSVFVDEAARRTGVFRALYQAVLERARAEGDVCGLRLYVETENAGAQATYEALGMQPAHYRMYELEFPPPGKSEGSQASH